MPPEDVAVPQGARRPSPLLDRIRQREAGPISQGMSVLLGISGVAPAPRREAPASGGSLGPVEGHGNEPGPPPAGAGPLSSVEGAGAEEGPSHLNRGALLSRLQGTHQANLNRGFYALLNTGVAAMQAIVTPPEGVDATAYRVVLLDLDVILPNPHLPPVPTDGEAMDLLVQSIREQGILEPLQVHPAPLDTPGQASNNYWIVAGERRRQAAVRAGLTQVPVIVKDVAPRAGLQMFLSQSIHTYQLSILDHASVYRTLTQEMGMTPLQVASRIGAQPEDVEAELAFLGFDEPVQESLRDGRLSAAQARILLEAPDQWTRQALWEYAVHYRPNPNRMRYRLSRILAGDHGNEEPNGHSAPSAQ